jgi:hypothetical protein
MSEITQADRARAERWLGDWDFEAPPAEVESLAQAFADRVAEARLQWRSRMGLTPSTDAAVSNARVARDAEIAKALRGAAERYSVTSERRWTVEHWADRIEKSRGGQL